MRIRDTVELLLLAALWGVSFMFMRIAGPEFGPFAMVEVRVVIAALFLLPMLLLREGFGQVRENWGRIAIIGACNSGIPFLLFTYSILHITGGLSAILNGTAPLWTALIAWAWLSDRLSFGQVLGLFIGFAGVYLLVWDNLTLSLSGTLLAILAATFGAFLYGLAANMTKRYAGGISPLAMSTGSMMTATVIVLPGALLAWPEEPVSLGAWSSVIAMGVGSTALAYILYFRLIRNVGPARAIAVTYLVPVFAMLFGAVFIAEKITLMMIVACAVIFLGTALATGAIGSRRS